ncbi:DNA-methyltransferase [Lactococcus garvieae]|uniref:DNA-methyltransferase n=1 Tax=Lactococcus garvieae TaxID=1363 RepID=UPI003853A76D
MIEINKIYNEDCLEGMKRIPDNSVDIVLCDLPYGTTKLKWDSIIPMEPLFKEYNRVLKKNGVIVQFGVEPFTSSLIQHNLDIFREKLTWEKHKPSNFAAAKYVHMKYSEDIVVFAERVPTYNPQMQPRESKRIAQAIKNNYIIKQTKQGNDSASLRTTSSKPIPASKYDPDFKYPSNIIKMPAVAGNAKEKVAHPTQKPVKLFEYLIKTYSNEGDTVLDNCMGSGTTAIACMNTNRNFIGFELDSDYYKIILERIERNK